MRIVKSKDCTDQYITIFGSYRDDISIKDNRNTQYTIISKTGINGMASLYAFAVLDVSIYQSYEIKISDAHGTATVNLEKQEDGSFAVKEDEGMDNVL